MFDGQYMVIHNLKNTSFPDHICLASDLDHVNMSTIYLLRC